jgi:hypothetical protein
MLKRLLLVGAALALVIPASAQAAPTITATAHFERFPPFSGGEAMTLILDIEESGLEPFEFVGLRLSASGRSVGGCTNPGGNFASGRGFTYEVQGHGGSGGGGYADATGVLRTFAIVHPDLVANDALFDDAAHNLPKCLAKNWPLRQRSFAVSVRLTDPVHDVSITLPTITADLPSRYSH